MKRSKRIYILLGILAAVCLATFAAVKIEERQERIQNSEAVILEIDASDVQKLSWSYDDESLAFSRDESATWHWDKDTEFPVNEEKIDDLLGMFSSFSVSFVIENVDDYGQYGLDKPICTINLSTDEQSYTLELGDFSKLDSQRYVSIGDGNAYLVSTDPMDSYEITIRDIIENDNALDYDTIQTISFLGNEDWKIERKDESNDSVCEEDVYFAEGLPLDTERVDDYLSNMSLLSLTNYISYNATEDELKTYGLNDPELSVTVDYTTEGETGDVAGSYTLHISRSAEQRAMTSEEQEELTSWVAYARVGESKIFYEISSSTYNTLMSAGYDDLRHKEAFTADFDSVTSIDIVLEEKHHSLTTKADDEDEKNLIWVYKETEVDISAVQSAIQDLSAGEFTDEQPKGQKEISLTIYLNNENFPEIELTLYRYDGANCLATVDDKSFALVSRSEVVDLIEAVNAIVLN